MKPKSDAAAVATPQVAAWIGGCNLGPGRPIDPYNDGSQLKQALLPQLGQLRRTSSKDNSRGKTKGKCQNYNGNKKDLEKIRGGELLPKIALILRIAGPRTAVNQKAVVEHEKRSLDVRNN